MKTLKTIQVLANIGRIISKILFIICLVCVVLCVTGIVSVAITGSMVIDGKTVANIIEEEGEISLSSIYTYTAIAIVFCIAQSVLCKLSERYFIEELASGTPFTFKGAKDLLKLGVIIICVSIGATVIAAVVQEIFCAVFSDVCKIELENAGSVSIGITFIIISIIFKHGAELAEQLKNKNLQDE